MRLRLHTLPSVPLEAEVITPEILSGKSPSEALALPIYHGKEQVSLGDFFEAYDTPEKEWIVVEGDLSRVKRIGSGMRNGYLVVEGNVGTHLGNGLSGGEIVVEGHAGDWVGTEMSGGRITIKGDAGHMVGSAVRGASVGMRGGEIVVHGSTGNEAGHGMRRGMIAIGGNSGDYAGVHLKAGTIIVLGKIGGRPGAGMKRGTLVSVHGTELLPTFRYNCLYHPVFLRSYFLHLRRVGMSIEEHLLFGKYERWSGDALEMNRGEVLLYAGS